MASGGVLRSALRGLAGLVMMGAVVTAAPAIAQTGTPMPPKPVVGVIDLQHILAKSMAAQKVVAQRESYLDKYQTRAADVEKGLRETDQELGRLRSTLTPEAFNTRHQAFQARVAEFQAEVQKRRRNLERAFNTAMNEVQSAVILAADAIASQRGMNLLLYRTQVFLFDPSMDITEAVLARVDKDLPSVVMADPDSLPDLADEAGGAADQTRRR
ncbi:MAG: OmpH family outer membrane protein [Rhodospirillaceae bacterium]